MKRKWYYMVWCMLITLGLTACLNDDNDDNGPSLQEMKKAMSKMQGTYSGYMLYSESLVGIPDTVKNISWTVDSVITIKDFPVSILAKSFTSIVDSTLLADVKKLPAEDLTCLVGFYSIVDEGYTMNVIPRALKFTAATSKQVYDCIVYFMNGDEYSLGNFNTASSEMVLYMNTYGLQMGDEEQSDALFKKTYFKLVSTSKQ